MAKRKSKTAPISPEQIVRFLEDMRNLAGRIDEPTKAISLRIPENILRAVKAQAQFDGKKYQSLIIEYIRRGLFPKSLK